MISTGDTSWHYTNYSGSTWSTLGGDFNATGVANATFTTPFTVGQTCSWSSAGMVSDVQGWVSSSSNYHGWLIKSDLETTAMSFLGWWTVDGANANSNSALQPILHVEWHGWIRAMSGSQSAIGPGAAIARPARAVL